MFKKPQFNLQSVKYIYFVIRSGVASRQAHLKDPFSKLRWRGQIQVEKKQTKKANSPPLREPDQITENGSTLSVFVFLPEICTFTVTKQNLPLHNRPTKTLRCGLRLVLYMCQTCRLHIHL